jgi:catechol 2,3-dioxygenase-like lactoylglutathione lyase family enzyme
MKDGNNPKLEPKMAKPELSISAQSFCKDIEASKKFYTQVLKREIELDIGINVAWRVAQSAAGRPRPHHPGAPGERCSSTASPAASSCISRPDIENLWADVLASGAELLHPLHEEPACAAHVRFFDPDRHLIEVGEDMTVVMRRLSRRR